MDTLFLIYIQGEIDGGQIFKTFGPYLSLTEASAIMMDYTETILETEGIEFTGPYEACVMEVLPRQGQWIDIAMRARDIPGENGERIYVNKF